MDGSSKGNYSSKSGVALTINTDIAQRKSKRSSLGADESSARVYQSFAAQKSTKSKTNHIGVPSSVSPRDPSPYITAID